MKKEELILLGIEQGSFPQCIFKYRTDDANTEKIVADNQLWFADPTTFNDPYDCNTPIKSHATIPEIETWLKGTNLCQPHEVSGFAKIVKRDPEIIESCVKKILAKMGICCFSKIEDSILQWSHYADYHRGICFKFDIKEDLGFFETPINVKYIKTLPSYNHITQEKEIVDRVIKPKFDEWSYEKEIRIVKKSIDIETNSGSRAFTFKDAALKEIIFGTNTPNRVIKKYKCLCSQYKKSHVQFFKMSLGNSAYYQLVKQSI